MHVPCPRRALPPTLLALALAWAGASIARARPPNPSAAFALSLGPGALVHGLGHYYAGERRTAGLLFLTELAGLALMNLNHPEGPLEQVVGATNRRSLDKADLAPLGRVLFFGSWLYDLAKSPDAARRRRRQRVQQGFQLGLEPVAEGPRTSFNPRASYTVAF